MWEGANCTTINVENSFITLEDAKYYLSHLPIASPKNVSSSLLPYSADLVDGTEIVPNKETLPCKLCNNHIEMKQMRRHVGKHILEDGLENVCGFCGTQGCSLELVKSSGLGTSATLSSKSNCTHFSKFSLKAAEKSTKSSPCTNRPISCTVCHVVVWSYSLSGHYKQVHQEVVPPVMVPDEEKNLVLSKK